MTNRNAITGLWITEFYAWINDRGLLREAKP